MHTNLEEQSDQGLFVNLSNSKSLKKINWKILFTTLDHLVLIASQGVGGTLIFPHIRRLGPFFGVQNSEFPYFLGFSEK